MEQWTEQGSSDVVISYPFKQDYSPDIIKLIALSAEVMYEGLRARSA